MCDHVVRQGTACLQKQKQHEAATSCNLWTAEWDWSYKGPPWTGLPAPRA